MAACRAFFFSLETPPQAPLHYRGWLGGTMLMFAGFGVPGGACGLPCTYVHVHGCGPRQPWGPCAIIVFFRLNRGVLC